MANPITKTDVCVIGSGSGGGVVAKELAERGIRVVVLEAGRRFDPLRDYVSARPDWEIAGRDNSELFRVPALSKFTFGNESTGSPYEAHGVGGGTLVYLAYAVRMRPDDFQVYTLDGVGADWPITYEALVPYYRKVELELGVSGEAGDPWTPLVDPYPNPPFRFSYANHVMKRGCDKLGIQLWPAPMARLTRPFDGRPSCVQCGVCNRGCMSGAKSSMDVTYIRKAEATGKAVVWPQSIATRVEVDSDRKAKSVVYFDRNGSENELHADVIVISAGAIQSPRLLLNSRSKTFPDGLANSSGLVGKYFMIHFGSGRGAIFSDRIDSFRGMPGAISQDFAKTSRKNSFVRGWRIDLVNSVAGPIDMARYSPLWGAQFKKYMRQNFGHVAGIGASGEQLPDVRNCIGVDPGVRDEYGMPVPRMTLTLGPNEKSILTAMERNVMEICDAAGASQILYEHKSIPLRSAHNMGSCRMGKDPRTSVLNSFCQAHDVPNLFVVDASCFVTSGTANPSLTIHAIATRAAEYIAGEGKRGNLWTRG